MEGQCQSVGVDVAKTYKSAKHNTVTGEKRKKHEREDLVFRAIANAIKPTDPILERRLFQLTTQGIDVGRLSLYANRFISRKAVLAPSFSDAVMRSMFVKGIQDEDLRREVKEAATGLDLNSTIQVALQTCKRLQEAAVVLYNTNGRGE
ncbi:hypothetical protein J8273_0029 [Carpediemonas membranifera]|uniref:Uncharacterized protein n=1 Tax=Carpediemonas membranifera TaxID=201153 RepID=A0A8J6E0A5_9EUKA|nr:hypothetical protein J8273_0029 [Carpediemonas membranifera]|eukprot:KAG9394824.1 hypothetical protein J8273_0029 [Carpediemonas membranifera]